MKESNFIERRKEYRLPFNQKIIFTDGKNSMTAYAANLSRGGVFVTSLEPYPIDTNGFIAFFLPGQPTCLCVKAKVVHIVFDRQRCEVECGMGFQFQELNESQKSLLNLQILNDQSAYLELKRILAESVPDAGELARARRKLPLLEGHDLLHLRYKVNRICTIFEPAPDPFASAV
jgi:Tfp pilus assembly protein PilZ